MPKLRLWPLSALPFANLNAPKAQGTTTVLGYQRPNAAARCHTPKATATNLDLSCSAFDPGDTLPDYSDSVPSFSRRLAGQAVGIRSVNVGVGQIGLRPLIGQNYGPGANVFPLALTDRLGDTLIRAVKPNGLANVNDTASVWRSPANWISIAHTLASSPSYVRYRNEYLGRTAPDTTIAFRNSSQSDAGLITVPDCDLARDPNNFPQRVAPGGRIASSKVGSLSEGILVASPNPFNKELTVEFALNEHSRNGNLVVRSINSVLPLYTKSIYGLKGVKHFELAFLPPGVYVLSLSRDDKPTIQIKIIKAP